MISFLQKLIRPDQEAVTSDSSDINLAAAALLIEVMVIDQNFTAEEEATIKALLRDNLGVEEADAEILFETAKKKVAEATSLFQFTRQVNDVFDQQQKYELVVQLWKVAYADGNLDKYEEHIIRRTSELIHLPHSQFIKAKKEATN